MPQITVNEIDRSVVTRVVSDDKVKILCPIIASFGPGLDNTDASVKTFTDVTDFNRTFGYTYAEFNPFQNDKSRMYARELIKKGAAVSVVRVNNGGLISNLDIDGTDDRQTSSPSIATVCKAAMKSQSFISDTQTVEPDSEHAITTTTFDTPLSLGKTNIVPGTVYVEFTITVKNASTHNVIETKTITTNDYLSDGKFYSDYVIGTQPNSAWNNNICATVDYKAGTVTFVQPQSISFEYELSAKITKFGYIDTDFAKYTFCPQIKSITAKYSGSFGNNIVVSIAQVNTTRLAESYQYASISVYYVDRTVNYVYDTASGTSKISSQTINNVTLLENKLVSTNPESPDYFEDVEFEFIKIVATKSARSALGLVWSDINAHPSSQAQYSGFPVIPLRYVENLVQKYNTAAFLSGGTDFPYSAETLAKLQSGFKGYWNTTSYTTYGENWSVDDVNKYLEEVYGDNGIVPTTYAQLAAMYENYVDPYIYDFDFITASGFVYEKYDLDYAYTKMTKKVGTDVTVGDTATTFTQPLGKTYPETVTLLLSNADGTATMKLNDTPDTPSQGQPITSGKFKNGTTEVGTINYTTGVVSLTNANYTGTVASLDHIDVTFSNANYPKKATPSIPVTSQTTTSDEEDGYKAYYTDITPVHQSMLNLVNARQDCIALFDLPRDYDKTKVIEYSKMLNTSYGTIHHPWCWVNSPDVQGKQIIMAPSYIFLYTFLVNLINNVESQKWFPPAGVDRATARVVQRPDYEIGSTLLNIWQNDFISRVNPIMKLKQYGYVIYGQYTTLPAIDLYTHSALESLNVRLISNVVKKKIFDTCLSLAFEPNTSALWLRFYAQLDPFLRYMKYNQGLYDYRIVMDESTVTTDDINMLRCPGKVYIAPTRTAEYFDIDFIITDAGAVFTD